MFLKPWDLFHKANLPFIEKDLVFSKNFDKGSDKQSRWRIPWSSSSSMYWIVLSLGKPLEPLCVCKWCRASSKVISVISKTCFTQLLSLGGICVLEFFRHLDVPEIWGYLKRLPVYVPLLLNLWGLAPLGLSPDSNSLPGLTMAFREQLHRLSMLLKGVGFPACCCRRGSPRSLSGWDCRIFSYPLPFKVSASYSPLCSVLLEGCWGCESRFHLRLT